MKERKKTEAKFMTEGLNALLKNRPLAMDFSNEKLPLLIFCLASDIPMLKSDIPLLINKISQWIICCYGFSVAENNLL